MKHPSHTLVLSFFLVAFTWSSSAQIKFQYGFGGGVNFSSIAEERVYPIFEDVSGAEYTSEYTRFFSNIGNQYFFHGDMEWNGLVLSLKPGTYTSKFNKNDEIIFNGETSELSTDYLLRYFNIPLELKYKFLTGNFKPFLGGSIAYGRLMQQGGNANHSIIRSKFVLGPVGGAYYSFTKFDLVLSIGYNYGLHQITNKEDRYSTENPTAYSQSDIKLNNLEASLSVLFSLASNPSQSGKGALDCPDIKHRRRK